MTPGRTNIVPSAAHILRAAGRVLSSRAVVCRMRTQEIEEEARRADAHRRQAIAVANAIHGWRERGVEAVAVNIPGGGIAVLPTGPIPLGADGGAPIHVEDLTDNPATPDRVASDPVN